MLIIIVIVITGVLHFFKLSSPSWVFRVQVKRHRALHVYKDISFLGSAVALVSNE